jgi:3-isopropylmalate dehydrogenase
LSYSLNHEEAAKAVENAADTVLNAGMRTADITEGSAVSTSEMGSAIADAVRCTDK